MARGIWDDGLEMAKAIIRRHPDVFKNVPALTDVLFVLDDGARPTRQGMPVPSKLSKITSRLVDFIDAGEKVWLLEWFTANQGGWMPAQKQLRLAHELLRFHYAPSENGDGGSFTLHDPDIVQHKLILDRFGHRWADPTKGDVADILSHDFEWGKQGQSRLDIPVPGEETAADAAGDNGAAEDEVQQAVADGQGTTTRAGTLAPDAPEPHEAGEEPWELPHRYGPKPEADGEDQSDGTLPAPPVS